MKITILEKEHLKSATNLIEQFATDVLMGFSSRPKTLSSKYFYDDIGSQLFQQITKQKDYYPTSSEFEILSNCHTQFPLIIEQKEIDIIELGAGDGHKTKILIENFVLEGYKINFYPIDISHEAMKLLSANLKESENLKIHGVVGEYIEGLRFVRQHSQNLQLVLFLGSNIGNFDRVANLGFLRKLWKSLNMGDLLFIGFDLKKDISTLTRAYNDSAGVTRDFNLNVLNRINRELGGQFNCEYFEHFGVFNPILGAMESYLVSTRDQDIYIAELEKFFHFDAFEAIHLEYSFKYLEKDILELAKETGYLIKQNFKDSKNYFIDSLWEVKKAIL